MVLDVFGYLEQKTKSFEIRLTTFRVTFYTKRHKRTFFMTVASETSSLAESLELVRTVALATGLSYAGGVPPKLAWTLVQAGEAVLVDVRTPEERKFVGHVPESLHVVWASGTAMTRNPRFVRELEAKVGKDATVLLLCRSGKRSDLAADAAAKAGFTRVYNVLEGFEGEINDQKQRGGDGGWRSHGLPWIQD
jgi:rhodanese-related sulfurtransferase